MQDWIAHIEDGAHWAHSISSSAFEYERGEIYGAAGKLGVRVFELDCTQLRNADSLWGQFAVVFEFPKWFGRNWDALLDLLRDLSWFDSSGYLIIFRNEESIAEADAQIVKKLAIVLRHTAAYWKTGESESGPFVHPVLFNVLGSAVGNLHPLLSQFGDSVCIHGES